MRGIFRTTISLPLAGLMTISLAFLMAYLIQVDAEPGPAITEVDFDLFPSVDVIDVPDRPTPDLIDTIAPPPPVRLVVDHQAPNLDGLDPIGIVPPDIQPGGLTAMNTNVLDRPEQVVVRIEPVYPPRALERGLEGNCSVAFDLNAAGHPYNVRATHCTNPVFSRASVRSVQGWRYEPRVVDGQAVERTGRSVLIEFNLRN
jgi:periplasmic protein TonB